jgi:hypothetical protein
MKLHLSSRSAGQLHVPVLYLLEQSLFGSDEEDKLCNIARARFFRLKIKISYTPNVKDTR